MFPPTYASHLFSSLFSNDINSQPPNILLLNNFSERKFASFFFRPSSDDTNGTIWFWQTRRIWHNFYIRGIVFFSIFSIPKINVLVFIFFRLTEIRQRTQLVRTSSDEWLIAVHFYNLPSSTILFFFFAQESSKQNKKHNQIVQINGLSSCRLSWMLVYYQTGFTGLKRTFLNSFVISVISGTELRP